MGDFASRSDPGTTIRLFVSSTFLDFGRERQVLRRHVFPVLRERCAVQGFRFQPIDLRWGVSTAAGTERQTLRICLTELARCQRLSPDLFQLILLGDRYGTRFLPEQIPTAQIESLWPKLPVYTRELFERVYSRDENAVPAEYTLLPTADGQLESVPFNAEEELRLALVQAGRLVGFSALELLPFTGSATHREIQQGLLDLQSGNRGGVLAAIRSFGGRPSGTWATQFVEPPGETRRAQHGLQASVSVSLPQGQLLRYRVPWREAGPPADDERQTDITGDQALTAQFLAFLAPHLDAVIAARNQARQDRDLVALANAAFATQRTERVEGRDEDLAQVADYLAGDIPFPLVVTGAPGSGKSTLLAEVANRLMLHAPATVVVARYIGITPGTARLVDLLDGVRRELAARFGQPTPEPITDLSQLVATVAQTLQALDVSSTRPLILFVDALDQLGGQAQRMDWLPRRLAPHVRVVLSILPDRQELDTLRTWLPEEQVLTLGPLDRTAGQQVLQHWLSEDQRTLTFDQETRVLDAFEAAGGLPLYLRVAAQAARQWRSDTPLPTLPATTLGLLEAQLGALEAPTQLGGTLVRHALGDLAAARDGLGEDELLDVLAQDAAVRESMRSLNPFAPQIDPQLPLPMVLWARLHAELELVLTEREVDGTRLYTFYHAQVRTAVERRCLQGDDASARHLDLANYFAAHPWRYETELWNQRKLAELATQFARADAKSRLRETLTDARFLEGKLAMEGANATLADLNLVETDTATLHVAWVVAGWAAFLEANPQEVANQVEGRRLGAWILHDAPWESDHPSFKILHPTLPGDPALLRVFAGHRTVVNCCAFSPDGRLVVSGSDDNTLRLWDVASGQTVRVFTGHSNDVYDCAFSPDGRLGLSASSDNTLRLWDMESGETLNTFSGHTNWVLSCAFSLDGQLALSASFDQTLRLWDVASGRQLRIFVGHTGGVSSCAFSPDGRRVLSGSGDKTLRLWDVTSGDLLWTINASSGTFDGVHDCAFAPDGRICLSASGDGALRLWDVSTGDMVRIFTGQMYAVTDCAFSPDGRLALSASRNSTLCLWDVSSAGSQRSFSGHIRGLSSKVYGCAFSPDGGTALSASADKTLCLWDVASGQVVRVLSGHTDGVKSCAFSPDGQFVLSGSEDHTLRLWNVSTGQTVRTFSGHSEVVHGCAFSPDGHRILSASRDDTLRLWDVASGETIRVFETYRRGSRQAMYDCAFSPDGRLALSASSDFNLCLWDVETGEALHTLSGHQRWVTSCTFTPDGRQVVSASNDHSLRLWDVSSGEVVRVFTSDVDAVLIDNVEDCAMSRDGRSLLSSSEDGTLCLWELASGRLYTRWRNNTKLSSCAISPNGRYAMAGDFFGGVHFLEVGGVQEVQGTTVNPKTIPVAKPAMTGASVHVDGDDRGPVKRGRWPFRRR